jgi:hypothetical protein
LARFPPFAGGFGVFRGSGNGGRQMDEQPPIDRPEHDSERSSEPGLLTPSLTSFVLMATGATLMIAAVFGTELVREQDARFTFARLGIAGFGLLALLIGLAWFLDPPRSEHGE